MRHTFLAAIAVVFFGVVVSTASGETGRVRSDCPAYLQGQCDYCELYPGGGGYEYADCVEDCNQNEDICDNWCQHNASGDQDNCYFDPYDQISCGNCDCTPEIGPRVRSRAC
jgi:hypothetical protein